MGSDALGGGGADDGPVSNCHNVCANHVSASDTEIIAIQRFFLSSVPSRIAIALLSLQ